MDWKRWMANAVTKIEDAYDREPIMVGVLAVGVVFITAVLLIAIL